MITFTAINAKVSDYTAVLSSTFTGAAAGNYETPAKLRAFLAEKGIALSPADRAELDMLVPAKSSLLVSEL